MPDSKLQTPSAIFNYREHAKTLVARCPACGNGDLSRIRCLPDRYGYPVMLITCPDCTLNYLSETLTREGYDAFYAGPYRQLVWHIAKGPNVPYDAAWSARELYSAQMAYACQLEGYLRKLQLPINLRVLDAGGSTGVVAHELSKTFRFKSITVLDPAVQELPIANSIKGYLEDPIAGTYDLILCCETMDHLTKPATALKNMRKALAPGGLLYVDMTQKRTWGVHDKTIKIDHPLYWTATALEKALRAAGFGIKDIGGYKWHKTWKTRMLCQTS